MSNQFGLSSAGRRRVLRNVGLAAGAIGIVSVGFVAGKLFDRRGEARQLQLAADIPGFLWPNPPALPEFELTDHAGKSFNRSRLVGRWSLIYFGYTSCPDVCPISLSAMSKVAGNLNDNPALAEALQVVFVSVDPARDVPVLGSYVEHFGTSVVGATGDEKALMGIARPLGIVYLRHPPDDNGFYLVDHSNSVLLVDPEARLVAVFNGPHDPKSMSSSLRRIHEVVG